MATLHCRWQYTKPCRIKIKLILSMHINQASDHSAILCECCMHLCTLYIILDLLTCLRIEEWILDLVIDLFGWVILPTHKAVTFSWNDKEEEKKSSLFQVCGPSIKFGWSTPGTVLHKSSLRTWWCGNLNGETELW